MQQFSATEPPLYPFPHPPAHAPPPPGHFTASLHHPRSLCLGAPWFHDLAAAAATSPVRERPAPGRLAQRWLLSRDARGRRSNAPVVWRWPSGAVWPGVGVCCQNTLWLLVSRQGRTCDVRRRRPCVAELHLPVPERRCCGSLSSHDTECADWEAAEARVWDDNQCHGWSGRRRSPRRGEVHVL